MEVVVGGLGGALPEVRVEGGALVGGSGGGLMRVVPPVVVVAVAEAPLANAMTSCVEEMSTGWPISMVCLYLRFSTNRLNFSSLLSSALGGAMQ